MHIVKKVIDMTKPVQHTTLKAALITKMKWLFKTVAFVAIGFLMVHWLTGGQDEIINSTTPDHGSVMDIREPAPHSPDAVLSAHEDECWGSNDQPKADLPGAAIVQFKSGKTIYTKNHKLVDAAFNEALANIGFGDKVSEQLDPIALCI